MKFIDVQTRIDILRRLMNAQNDISCLQRYNKGSILKSFLRNFLKRKTFFKYLPRSCEDADDPPLSDLGGFPIESAGL